MGPLSAAQLGSAWTFGAWLACSKRHDARTAQNPLRCFCLEAGAVPGYRAFERWQACRRFFGQNSYASLYPQSGHLYLEKMWTLNESGAFVEPVEASKGMLFRSDDYHLIEVFDEGA